jgi:hypothetical protein
MEEPVISTLEKSKTSLHKRESCARFFWHWRSCVLCISSTRTNSNPS